MSHIVYPDICCLKRAFDDQRQPRIQRAREIGALGFDPLDALHTAFAEEAGARVLVTTDDRLVELGQRHRAALRVEIANPIRAVELFKGGNP